MAEILEWLNKVNLLRHTQRVGMQEERKRLEDHAVEPGASNPGAVRQEIRKLDKQLNTQSPRETTPEERDLLAKTERELQAEIVHGMPTHEEMRRNPPGTVHKHMQFEKHFKPKLNLLKNIKIQLEPTSDDPDLANLERIRPHQTENGAGTFMANAQIPGHFAMTPQAKANWPVEMPAQGTANSVLAQAVKRERTPEERKAFGQKMKEARAKKQAAAKEA